MLFIHRIWNWCKRFRHRCGYGVHSPSDFFLITSVVYESLPYYAYRELKNRKYPSHLPHYRRKVNRLLFRLVNHFRPQAWMEIGPGNGASTDYMRAARTSMQTTIIDGREKEATLNTLRSMNPIDFLHIGFTPYYKEVLEEVLPHLSENACIVVGGIYDSKEKREWWKELQKDERIHLSFDLYDIGLILFDKKRFKQHYVINFL